MFQHIRNGDDAKLLLQCNLGEDTLPYIKATARAHFAK